MHKNNPALLPRHSMALFDRVYRLGHAPCNPLSGNITPGRPAGSSHENYLLAHDCWVCGLPGAGMGPRFRIPPWVGLSKDLWVALVSFVRECFLRLGSPSNRREHALTAHPLPDATVISFLFPTPVGIGFEVVSILREPFTKNERISAAVSMPSFVFSHFEVVRYDSEPRTRVLAVVAALVCVCGSSTAITCLRCLGSRTDPLVPVTYFIGFVEIVAIGYMVLQLVLGGEVGLLPRGWLEGRQPVGTYEGNAAGEGSTGEPDHLHAACACGSVGAGVLGTIPRARAWWGWCKKTQWSLTRKRP